MSLKRIVRKTGDWAERAADNPIRTLAWTNPLTGSIYEGAKELGDMTDVPELGAGSSEQTLAEIARRLFEQSDPTRQAFFGNFEDVLAGRFDPTTSPIYAPTFSTAKEGISDQYGLAKENILSFLPRGGTMSGALGDLEMERAKTEAGLPAMISQKITDDMMNKAYGAAFGPSLTAPMQGLGTVAGLESNRNLMNAQLAAQQNQMLWGGLGSLAAMAMFGRS